METAILYMVFVKTTRFPEQDWETKASKIL